MASQGVRRRPSAADRTPLTESVIAARATTTTFSSPAELSRASSRLSGRFDSSRSSNIDGGVESMPPPPVPYGDDPAKRRTHSRTTSTASRQMNRLSITLPVAPPNGEACRLLQSPPLTSASVMPFSVPPTPLDTPPTSATPPSSANEFIIAIAAQERRVLELKEELARAESELNTLKKQWASAEVYRKRSDSQRTDSSRHALSGADEDALVASRRSIELDRRKILLQSQNSTPQPSRKVFRGGHTRTLSLLSPAKSEGGFSGIDDIRPEPIGLPPVERRATQLTNPNLAKRASWQPRTQQNPTGNAVPQIVEDFKFGLRAFVEDIRQITIGDEPVTGQSGRSGSIASSRNGTSTREQSSERDASKPIATSRSRVNTGSEHGSPAGSSTAQFSTTPESKPKNGKMKHYSWTPLGFDSLEDTDWSSWDSPTSSKSARWSGSTTNSSSMDDIQSIPEKGDEDMVSPTKKPSIGDAALLSPALEELLPNVVSRIKNSNFNKTASNLMDEWEKSLVSPNNGGKKTRV